jgi:hypothetical protein
VRVTQERDGRKRLHRTAGSQGHRDSSCHDKNIDFLLGAIAGSSAGEEQDHGYAPGSKCDNCG